MIVPPSADDQTAIRRRRRDSAWRTRARGVVDDRSDVLVAVSCAVVPYERPSGKWRPSEYQARTSIRTEDGCTLRGGGGKFKV